MTARTGPSQIAIDELALRSEEAGPKAVISLVRRGSPLAKPAVQLQRLAALTTQEAGAKTVGPFAEVIRQSGRGALIPAKLETFQVNLGKLCNMTCRHCHVDAGPDRLAEMMDRETVDLCLAALDQTECTTVDITGGAPELNPHFRYLVDECVRRGKHVIDRCNLTILLVSRMRELPEWFAERGVELVCSLPHYRERNTDAQRGAGTYTRSVEALRRLNAVGYGYGDPRRVLTLMTNPAGAFLTAGQQSMEREWKAELMRLFGVSFDRLIALNNMPIARFLEWLIESDNLDAYMRRLRQAFNPETVNGLMCRNAISVSWDGRVFDCDFNQMLDLEARPAGGSAHIRDFRLSDYENRPIVTDQHCFGCTAGCGSSCGGATA